MKARGVIRITPDDVGQRVTVRALIDHAPGEPSMSDTVGVLRSWDAGELRIERRDGTLVSIAETSVIAGRIIFVQAPPRRFDVE